MMEAQPRQASAAAMAWTASKGLRLPGTLVVPDLEPGAGALMGLYSGLRAVTTPLATATACDMPFVSTALLRELLALASEHDAVVPIVGGQPEPLHAVYRTTCVTAIEAALDEMERRGVDGRLATIGDVAAIAFLGYLDFRWPDMTWRGGRDGLAEAYAQAQRRASLAQTLYRPPAGKS